MSAVADRVYRLGDRFVNWYLVEDGGRFTVIDAGLIGQYEQLGALLARTGKSPSDVDAVVLTHAHADHLGSTARIQSDAATAVHVHRDDAAMARGEAARKVERGISKDLVNPFAWRVAWWWITSGGLKTPPPVTELSAYAHGDVLDVPGRPRVIHTPGHTGGASSIHLADRRVVCCGDTLATLNMAKGTPGPQILPGSFNEDSSRALESLSELEGVDADLLLPGHGEPWSGSMTDAVALARKVGAT